MWGHLGALQGDGMGQRGEKRQKMNKSHPAKHQVSDAFLPTFCKMTVM